jgi:hypothetical protein
MWVTRRVERMHVAVIVRNCALGRTIQYSRNSAIESISRGVLDRPVKPGDDGGLFDS